MLKYIYGLLKNLFNPAVSLLAKVDNLSHIDRRAKIYRKTKVFNSSIGRYSYLGRGSSLIYAEVGQFCSIAGNTIVGPGIHPLNNLSTSPIFTERLMELVILGQIERLNILIKRYLLVMMFGLVLELLSWEEYT